ncbi:MAG: uroporphyrinogen decarboxylase family protein [Armatimonadota bacterium]
MLPRERILTTLKHQEPDLVPWGEHLIDYDTYEFVLGRESFVNSKFRETRAYWDGRRDEVVASYKRDIIDLADALGLDMITVPMMPSKGYAPKSLEQLDQDTYRDDAGNLFRVSSATHQLMPYKMNTDAYTEPTLDSLHEQIDNIDRNGYPQIDPTSWEVINHAVKERKSTHFIATFWGGSGWPSFGQTDEDFYINLITRPEMHAPIAELYGKTAIAGLEQVALTGVDAVISPGDMGSSTGPLANPDTYRKHVLPWDKLFVDEAHKLGLLVFKHCCGRVWDFLEDFIEIGYDGYEGIQASAGMDMKLLKETVGDRLNLWGGVTNENLILGKPEDVIRDAEYAIKWGAPGGGFIYGASHSIAVATKPENLMAMKETREKCGVYPISI